MLFDSYFDPSRVFEEAPYLEYMRPESLCSQTLLRRSVLGVRTGGYL